ncbi:MAG: 8-amino-7-oxononanoate synthase [Angustibacter sp.]
MTKLPEWLAAGSAARAADGLTRALAPRPSDGDLLDLAGNDYLGLARHPRVVAAASDALRRWGVGATASRLVTGSTTLHADVEHRLAGFCRQPTALLFSSGYLANLGVVTALAGRGALVVSDAHVHASLVDACRLSRARVQVVPHHDVAAVRDALATRSETRAVVLCESVYSVLGDVAPLPELADACADHDAALVVDEAHALGVCGPGGRGLVAANQLTERAEVVVTATLSKALGSQGGVVLGDGAIREHLVNTARPFIYDTGVAPTLAAAAAAALNVLEDEPERLTALRRGVVTLADATDVPHPGGAVLAVPLPSPQAAQAAAARCADAGIRVGCFRPPSVPDGVSRLRITARADLTDTDLGRASAVLADVLGRAA